MEKTPTNAIDGHPLLTQKRNLAIQAIWARSRLENEFRLVDAGAESATAGFARLESRFRLQYLLALREANRQVQEVPQSSVVVSLEEDITNLPFIKDQLENKFRLPLLEIDRRVKQQKDAAKTSILRSLSDTTPLELYSRTEIGKVIGYQTNLHTVETIELPTALEGVTAVYYYPFFAEEPQLSLSIQS